MLMGIRTLRYDGLFFDSMLILNLQAVEDNGQILKNSIVVAFACYIADDIIAEADELTHSML